MNGELNNYCLRLINDVPHEVYVVMLIALCVGTLLMMGLSGFRNGIFYSLRLLFVEYVFLLYASTVIYRIVKGVRKYDFTPFWSYRAIMDGSEPQLLSENLMNVVVFIPVGLLLGLSSRSMTWIWALLIGASLSVGIESLQFIFLRGFSEFDDVMHNTLGCMIGYGISSLFRFGYERVSKSNLGIL